jgi:hypothetical protein
VVVLFLGEKVKRRILILVTLAMAALVCVNIAPAHLLWSGNAASSHAAATAAEATPVANAGAVIPPYLGLNLSEPMALLLLGTLLFSVAQIRKRFQSSQNGSPLQK